MIWIKLISCFVLLLPATLATRQCNTYNFQMQAMYMCGLHWWQNQDIGQVIDVRYNISDLVKNSLQHFGLDPDRINQQSLSGAIAANSSDPLAKIIESGLTVEPYLTYVLADLILGYKLTPEELQRFAIPGDVASSTYLKSMYKSYFKFSCSDFGVRSAMMCVKRWIGNNCVEEDNPNALIRILDNFENSYCDGTSVRSDVVNKLGDDLGTVFKDVVDYLGIYKDPVSEYLFNIRYDSLIFNQTVLHQFISSYESDCGYMLQSFSSLFVTIPLRNATEGAGTVIEIVRRASDAFMRCSLRSLRSQFPGLLKKSKSLFDHLSLLSRRYTEMDLTLNDIDVATSQRYTVTVFGDPHIVPYKASNPSTCSALGWQTYLTNEYFVLSAFSEPAVEGSLASYVTKIKLTFHSRDEVVIYESSRGQYPSAVVKVGDYNMTSTGEVTISKLGDGVQIIDSKSGALFAFRKYKHTYFFTIRMGEKLFDGSLGLLVTGCPTPMDISSRGQTGRKKRRVSACQIACSTAPAEYRDTCVYDCEVTGDTEVAEITKGVDSLIKEVESTDVKVLKMIGYKATTPSTGSMIQACLSMAGLLISLVLLTQH